MDRLFSSGFITRPAVMEDAADLASLIGLRDRLEYPPELDYQPEYTVEDLQAEWQSLDLAADTRVVFAPGGQLVGYLGGASGTGASSVADMGTTILSCAARKAQRPSPRKAQGSAPRQANAEAGWGSAAQITRLPPAPALQPIQEMAAEEVSHHCSMIE